MTASKFGAEYAAPEFNVPYPGKCCCASTDSVEQLREQNECMREALAEACRAARPARRKPGGKPR